MLRIKPNAQGFWTAPDRILLCGAVCREYIFLKPLREDFVPGVDALMYNPLVFFRFCASGVLVSKSEDALLNVLLVLMKKFSIKHDVPEKWKSQRRREFLSSLLCPMKTRTTLN